MAKACEAVADSKHDFKSSEELIDALRLARALGGELTAASAAAVLDDEGFQGFESAFMWMLEEGCDLSTLPPERSGHPAHEPIPPHS